MWVGRGASGPPDNVALYLRETFAHLRPEPEPLAEPRELHDRLRGAPCASAGRASSPS
ncbi:MAG: hypothetical protein R3F62_14270 [Planctomycetota bacterium]